MVHVDLYRLAPEEIETLGLDEQMASPGIVAIEWADRLEDLWGPLAGPGILAAEILRDEDGRRQILLRGDLDRLPKTQTDLS